MVAWDAAYRAAGLQVIGIHSPEYAFEKDAANVAAGAKAFGITYPVALDNNLSTWTNYRNRYWPAHYLIDAQGTVRHISFGEGGYADTEKLIRELLEDADPVGRAARRDRGRRRPRPTSGSQTRETFLGSSKDVNFAGPGAYRAGEADFSLPSEQACRLVRARRRVAGRDAVRDPAGAAGRRHPTRLPRGGGADGALRQRHGDCAARWGDGKTRVISVDGMPRSYPVVEGADGSRSVLAVEVPPGVEVYSFTFG